MHTRYSETVDEILAWSKQDSNVECAVLIGSQTRNESKADEWSDLDVMLLASDPAILLAENDWVGRFGKAVCVFNEITVLHFVSWNWCVKRVLFEDRRDVDFSILPYDQLDDVLAVNREVMSKGYRVLYDSRGDLVDSKIRTMLETIQKEAPRIPTEKALRNDLYDLLFHIIWALKKIKRKELWVAVSCINGHIRDLLLGLIECHNVSRTGRSSVVMYDGRFLEDRTDREIIDKLRHCFAKYDESDAIHTLGHLIEVTYAVSKEVFEANGYRFDEEPFKAIRRMYGEVRGE